MMEENSKEYEFSQAVILLMKGAIQRDEQQKLWNIIMEQQAKISDYVAKLGLFLIVDKTAGYAFLRQDDNTELPRLVNRHQLGYGLSILLIMLRKGLGEFDSINGSSYLLMTRKDIQLKLKSFYPSITNETRYINEIDRNIRRAMELGFLREVPGDSDTFEVRELIRSFVTAQWLKDFDDRLQDYMDYGARNADEGKGETAGGLI